MSDKQQEIAEASILFANHQELTSEQILDNLYKKLEHFDPEDQVAGVFFYNAIAKILHKEDHEKSNK